MESKTKWLAGWVIAGVAFAVGVVVLAAGLLSPVTFGWFAYQPLAGDAFVPLDGGAFVSRTTIIGWVILVIGLIAVAFLAGWSVAGRRREASSSDSSSQTDVDRLVHEYLASLEAADAARAIALFAPDGIVESPLYGTMPATEFYPVLLADTANSRLTLRATTTGSTEGRAVVSFWFDFDWTLSTGEPAPFTVVDVAELDKDGLIEKLHIVYDTFPIRDAFNDAHDGEH